MTTPRQLPDPVQKARQAIITQGDSKALPLIEALRIEHPDLDDLHALCALLSLWTGNVESADLITNKQLSVSPGAGSLSVGAEIAEYMADEKLFEQRMRQAISLDSDHFLVLRVQVSHAHMHNEIDTAVRHANRSLLLYPEDPNMLSQLISTLRTSDRIDEMMKILNSPPDWYKDTAQYHNARGMNAFRNHDLITAEQEWKKAVAICSYGYNYWANLSMAQRFLEKDEEAEQSARNSLDLNGRSLIALRSLAKLAGKHGDKESEKTYNIRAQNAIPVLKSTDLSRRARDLRDAGKNAEANRLLREAAHSPHIMTARTARSLLISALITENHWEKARKEIENALPLDGLTDSLRISRIKIMIHDGDTKEALKEIRDMLAQPNPYPRVYAPAISLLLKDGKEEEAEPYIERVINELPGAPNDLIYIFLALKDNKRTKDARRFYEVAIRRYSNNTSLKILTVGYSIEDGNFGQLGYYIRQLPPIWRKRFLTDFKRRNRFNPRFWFNYIRSRFK